MPEFDYKQRKTTDSYRKGWEKIFSGKYKGMMKPKEYKETTEQKQPLVTNPSTE